MKSYFGILRAAFILIICLPVLLCQQACSIKKHIPEGQYLVDKVSIKGEPVGYNSRLYNLSRQKPNKKLLGVVRFNMWWYLLGNQEKKKRNRLERLNKLERKLFDEKRELNNIPDEQEKKRRKQFRAIKRAEYRVEKQRDRVDKLREEDLNAPVLLDSNQLDFSVVQMEAFLMDKGFMHSRVNYNVNAANGKAKIVYEVKTPDPFIVNRFEYEIEDPQIDSIIKSDTARRYIKVGDRYDADNLEEKRTHIYELLSDKGYFEFRPSYINFIVDTNLAGNNVDVYLNILNPADRPGHRVYKIGDVHVEPEYIFGDTLLKNTFLYNGIVFHSNAMEIKPGILSDFIFIRPGSIYRERDKRRTLNRLARLQNYRFVDIQFQPDTAWHGDTGQVHVFIRLTPLDRQNFDIDLELNTSDQPERGFVGMPTSDNRMYGIAGSYAYRNRNLAKRALQFESRVRGAIEIPITFLPVRVQDTLINYLYGFTNSLIFPQLLSPFKLPGRWRQLPTQTSFNLNILYERNQDFNRTTANTNLTYQLTNRNYNFFVTPIELSLVNARLVSENFRVRLSDNADPLILNLFDRHLITDLRMGMLINQQPINLVRQKGWVLRTLFEVGGLVPYLIDQLDGKQQPDSNGIIARQVFGITYFNYTKFEIDYRRYWPIFKESNLAVRAALGYGIPFFNSQILPFEKRFYVGGANSIRAWRARDLGPGTFVNPPGLRFDKSGDVKFEFSIEDRFPVYGVLQGALFIDAGNVWVTKRDPYRIGAKFSNEFYKEFAIGGGFGTRFDFNFFILRLDFALPLRDPRDGWLFREYGRWGWINEFNVNIGINYPF